MERLRSDVMLNFQTHIKNHVTDEVWDDVTDMQGKVLNDISHLLFNINVAVETNARADQF